MDRRLGLLALTVAFAAGLGVLVLSSTGSPSPRGLMHADAPALALLIGWSFAGAGVTASVLRPHNRFGLLLYGKAFDELTLFRVGHAYEQATEWHKRRPSLG